MSDKDTAELFSTQLGSSDMSAQHSNSKTCWEFYNGDSMSYRSRIQYTDTVKGPQIATVEFNEVQPPIDATVGFMAQNRRQPKYVANISDSEKQELYTKNMNAYSSYHRDNANMDHIETDLDLDMLVCGYGASETDLSYLTGNSTRDPNGEILEKRIGTDRLYWDTTARQKNLLDARWVGYSEDFDLKDALNLFQDSTKADFEPVSDDDSSGYTYNPFGGLYDKIRLSDGPTVSWVGDKKKERVRVYNHQWYEIEPFWRCENPIYKATTPEEARYYQSFLDVIAAGQKPNEVDGITSYDLFTFDPTSEYLS